MNTSIKYIALLIVIIFSNLDFAFAQENYNNKFSASSTINYKRFNIGNSRNGNFFSIAGPQIAYSFKNKRQNWHEIELVGFNAGYSNYGNGGRYGAALVLRYQYNIFVFKKHFIGKVKPFIGPGILNVSTFNKSADDIDHNNNIRYASKSISNTISFNISPGVEYNFSPKFYTTFQIPLNIVNLTNRYNRTYDPSYTKREQRSSNFRFNVLPLESINARLSLGYKF